MYSTYAINKLRYGVDNSGNDVYDCVSDGGIVCDFAFQAAVMCAYCLRACNIFYWARLTQPWFSKSNFQCSFILPHPLFAFLILFYFPLVVNAFVCICIYIHIHIHIRIHTHGTKEQRKKPWVISTFFIWFYIIGALIFVVVHATE